ncbi:MAG: hypothetical protein JEY99_05725 [Spirochaetales bacterium]|nr:hypothetical protein [Spirochaetales bacterium]
MGTVSRIQVKQVLRRNQLVDHYFGNRYSFSPYRACTHACLYCDGRAEKYYIDGDFASDIVIRDNLLSCLEPELNRLREKGYILAGSGVTDAYQPVEAEEKLMSGAAELLIKKKFPVIITTKSVLINRDIEKWKILNEKSGFILLHTLCTLVDSERLIFEPGAPKIEERLKMLADFKNSGIPVGVMAMPLLPFIWDSNEKLEALFTAMKNLVDYILPGTLTLRPGIQKETFQGVLRDSFPGLLPEYERIYGENRPSGVPLYSYQKDVYGRIFNFMTELGIPHQMPHRLFRQKISLPDEIHILLKHLEELYRPRGIDTRPVKEAEKRYASWLRPVRMEFNRKRSLPDEWLEERLKLLASEKKLGTLLENEKLGKFLEEIILEPVEFDYIKLKLIETSERAKGEEEFFL